VVCGYHLLKVLNSKHFKKQSRTAYFSIRNWSFKQTNINGSKIICTGTTIFCKNKQMSCASNDRYVEWVDPSPVSFARWKSILSNLTKEESIKQLFSFICIYFK
jgi:predicted metal-binding transcription factor (methanogenesis marker protein 9)